VGLWGKRRKVASARELDNGLLLAMLVWLNLPRDEDEERESSRLVRHDRAFESTAGA